MASLLTHPALARRDAPYPEQGRNSAADPRFTFHASRFPGSDARTPLGSRRVSARQGWAGETSDFFNGLLASGHGSHDKKRLVPRRDRVGQRSVCRFVRQILIAGEEPHERAAL